MNDKVSKRIRVYGIVQGVGFRPTVARHAAECGICGSVSNKGPYVEIFAQGERARVERFVAMIREQSPKRAAILKMNIEDLEKIEKIENAEEFDKTREYTQFDIIESEKTKGEIFVSPDIAICDDCAKEMFDPENRRYLHPFINCTCCGPRLTILDSLPYDRERTSMKEFPMCGKCEAEYHNPDDRRYDAQPVCCNECGPEVYLIGREEKGREAISYTRKIIASGGIAAIKGIGGFHLCCDATNEDAVMRLRELKKRPAKPFAVMAADMEAVRRECVVSKTQEQILTGHQKPILLLDKKPGKIAESVAPENSRLGIMLPYAPVQLLLFSYDDGIQMPDVLVMTSGNTSGAPICRDDSEAIEELSHLCGCMLSHSRKIRIRADDSVMDFYKEKPYMIRRSRGYAPLPYMVSQKWTGQVLAVGGELKNTFCIGHDNRFYPGPYVGDLEDLRTVKALRETIKRLETLLEVKPEIVACDLHPKYNSVMVAEEIGLPVVKVQHHYAHVLSCMAENDCKCRLIGVSFDGTGYGTDGTVWGGEILLADYRNFERIGSIEPFCQAGGDLAAKEGFRIAVALIYEMLKDKSEAAKLAEKLGICSAAEAQVIATMVQKRVNSVASTSAGRLFDGISAILGIRLKSTFEGEASMALQEEAEKAVKWKKMGVPNPLNSLPDLELKQDSDGRLLLNTGGIVEYVLEQRLKGENVAQTAYEFHYLLADQIVKACVKARELSGCEEVALSGGVFQNKLLLKLTDEGLERAGFKVLRHHLIPPNDGGIGLGQAVYAMQYLNDKNNIGDFE